MSATVVVGCQFGDEGKGKVIDFLAANADVVVRFQGGANAGHTVQVGEELYAFHLLPSGVLRTRTMNVIGNGVVVDPAQLLKEIDETRARGHPVTNLRISDRAHIVMPYHKVLDGLEEKLKGGLGAGTTLRGIGPAFEDKVGRFGIRMCDLIDPELLRAKLQTIVPIKQRLIEAYGGQERLDADALFAEYEAYGKRLAPFVDDTSAWLDAARKRRKRLLFEGAQGTHLCIDHGVYPFGTSSDCVSGAAAVGAGIGPQHLTDVIGVAKAFTSRVGAGPFPTELNGPMAEHLRERGGGEYGTTTRRPRRVGWLDLVMLRMAVRVNGLTRLAVTKLDVLGGLDRIRVCVGYRQDGGILKEFPASMRVLSQAQPMYREFKGWPDLPEPEWIGIAKRGRRALPESTQRYVAFIESQLKVPVRILSVGRSRAATMGR
jgi:adenylosuccinate synthase